MVTIAFGQVFYYIAFQWSSLTGGDDGLRGFSRQPIDFGLFKLDILSSADSFYYFVLFCFALVAGAMAFILRSPFGRHHGRNPRERAPRALPRYPRRAAYLDRVYVVLFLHGVCRRALCARQPTSADPRGTSLQPVGRFRHDGCDGAGCCTSFLPGPLLGAAVYCGFAGLPVEHHRPTGCRS